MQSIHLLDSDTINKIAAGEVVERPASVVKELVENAIDARASAITVEISNGGLSLIRVTDNGSGIAKDDVETAFLRHATSKIQSAMDLLTIGSLGFRGEALSSIVAVAQVELITKVHGELTGIRYVADGGEKKSMAEVGCPDGTTFIVKNLFYNTPARRKFLKSSATEAGYVSDLVERLALSHPDISFKFINNNQNKLHTSGNANLKDIIYQIYGRDITAQLMPAEYESDIFKLSGYIGKPILSKGNRTWENYFINGRYIKSTIITKAIEEAYKTFVMIHKYPFVALHFELDPHYIDVNVHPRKMEVRFNQNEQIYQQVYQAVRGLLEHRELIPSVSLQKTEERPAAESKGIPEPFEVRRLAAMGQHTARYQNPPENREKKATFQNPSVIREDSAVSPKKIEPVHSLKNDNQLPKEKAETAFIKPIMQEKQKLQSEKTQKQENQSVMQERKEEVSVGTEKPVTDTRQMVLFEDKFLGEKAKKHHRLIGQVFKTYWMVEYDGKLFIIDQHAAHEKVLFERLMKDFLKHQVNKQLLSPPAILTLSMPEMELCRQYADYFQHLGFEIEPFGGRDYAIRAVPLQLFGMDAKDIFMEVLDNLSEESAGSTETAIVNRIATMACKAAVKGNNVISFEEANELIEELLEADNPYTCPHGRPTIISLSQYELEKKFKRIQ